MQWNESCFCMWLIHWLGALFEWILDELPISEQYRASGLRFFTGDLTVKGFKKSKHASILRGSWKSGRPCYNHDLDSNVMLMWSSIHIAAQAHQNHKLAFGITRMHYSLYVRTLGVTLVGMLIYMSSNAKQVLLTQKFCYCHYWSLIPSIFRPSFTFSLSPI